MDIKQIAKEYKRPEHEFLKRIDGRIEWICSHGVGHTVFAPGRTGFVHGCDGCCIGLKAR